MIETHPLIADPRDLSFDNEFPASTSAVQAIDRRADRKPGLLRRWTRKTFSVIGAAVWHVWCLASLVALLAVVTEIPLLQLAVLGYLLLVSGRLASGMSVRQSVPGRQAAGQIGLIFLSLGIASLPTRLLAHWESVAAIIDPRSANAANLRTAAIAFAIFATVYLWWAWARGGRWKHYYWPQPIRFVKEAWRPGLWIRTSDRLWAFTVSLRLPMLFWLGLRGAAATLIWLIPAMIIMGVTREGKQAAAGLLGGLCFVILGVILMTLPMLQVHFAAENRFRAMFDWRRVRRDLRFAPWSYAAAMLVALVLMPIPLYLLKIEATPQEITWLPCLVFVAFMLPARIATGLALRRGRRLRIESDRSVENGLNDGVPIGPTPPRWRSRWQTFSRRFVRFVVAPAIVIVYMAVLLASQYTSWDGVDTWVRQHALLVPVPFIGI